MLGIGRSKCRWNGGSPVRLPAATVTPWKPPRREMNLLPFRTTDEIVVVPHQLDLGVVGVRTRKPEIHPPGIERHHCLELLGQQHTRFVGLGRE